MKDELFINTILQKGSEAREKVKTEFTGISPEQLNWKPSPNAWSIGQCLEHLLISDSTYFMDLEKITRGNYQKSFWERYSPLTSTWGRFMKQRLQEQVGTKMKAPKKIQPSQSNINMSIMDRYHKNLDQFLGYISKCGDIDIDKTILTSPIASIVTYSLRDGLQFLIQHEHRHINQATRVKQHNGFP